MENNEASSGIAIKWTRNKSLFSMFKQLLMIDGFIILTGILYCKFISLFKKNNYESWYNPRNFDLVYISNVSNIDQQHFGLPFTFPSLCFPLNREKIIHRFHLIHLDRNVRLFFHSILSGLLRIDARDALNSVSLALKQTKYSLT